MLKSIPFILLLLFLSFLSFGQAESRFFDQETWREGTSITLKSKGLLSSMNLQITEEGLPIFYWKDIFTPVCSDSLCKPVYITILWDLLGNFYDYKLKETFPLTKVDHEPFDKNDYQRLLDILSNEYSILKSYDPHEVGVNPLPNATADSYQVDGISGATPKTVQREVIKGAFYTCKTLWHLVNGAVKEELLIYTNSVLLNEDLLHAFFTERKEQEIIFALEHLSEFETEVFKEDLLNILQRGNPYLSKKVLQKLPKLLLDDQFVISLMGIYPSMNFQSQQLILQLLAQNRDLPDVVVNRIYKDLISQNESLFVQSVRLLSKQNSLSKRQRKTLMKSVRQRKENNSLSEQSLQELKSINIKD